MVRLSGAALGLFAFCVTILLGLAAGNPANVTLLRALWAMLIFCVIGLCVGWVAYRVLDEHAVRRHREMFLTEEQEEPTPDSSGNGQEGAAPSVSGDQGMAEPG